MVSNTSELLPEPETPVNAVSRRFGISTLTSLRLFWRAPCTRITSCRSATSKAADCVPVLVAMLFMPPSVLGASPGAAAATVLCLPDRRYGRGAARTAGASNQPTAVAHQLAVTYPE